MKQEEYWWTILNARGQVEVKVRVMLVGREVVLLEDVWVAGMRIFQEGERLSREYKELEKIVSAAEQVDSVID